MRLSHLFIASLPLAALALVSQVQNAQISAHTDALQKAPSMTLTVTAQKLGGQSEEYTLTLSKPGMFKLDTPARTLVTDGKMVWDFDKKAKSYTEDAVTPEGMKKLLSADNLWLWSAFFNADFSKDIASAKLGASRNIKGNIVKELVVTLAKDANKGITLFMDEKLKVARGALIKADNVETIYTATKLEFGTEALPAGGFAFAAPAGATKIDRAALEAAAPKFSEISSVFTQNCAPCHTQESKGRLNVGSYQRLMRGGEHGAIITPGDSKNSNLFKYLNGQGRPKMPPQGNVSQADQDKIAKWIDAGAKE